MTQTSEVVRSNETAARENGAARRTYVPNVDIFEADGDLQVLVDLPGACADSIRVDFEDGVLTIDADVAERQPEGTKYVLREYGVGGFHRSFRVSNTVDASKIEAKYRDGVLTLTLPKVDAAKPRRIEVRG